MRTPKSKPSMTALLLAAIACGPPGVGDPQAGDATGSASEESSASAESGAETETETSGEGSEGPGILPKFDRPRRATSFWGSARRCPERALAGLRRKFLGPDPPC